MSDTATLLAHLVEYPAGSGRNYHRHADGSVLRLEAKLGGTWHDLTCDVVEVNIQWGDVAGDNLTPYSDPGQCQIILKDLDGRYGPLPPTGFPLFTRWVPVRVWTGFVADPEGMPVDHTTRYGTPGTFGGSPPDWYGGTARSVHADGISCRFSGWLMSMERTPEADPITTWACGDGMVRLVDQTVRDYDLSTPPGTPVTDAHWPPGLRENAPGNYRVSQLVSFVRGPTGASYGVVSEASPTKRMMQSPGGLVGDLVQQVAESDRAFFWWQPDVTAADHDTPADWFGYQTFEWLGSHGLEWPIQCDGIHGYDGTLVVNDNNFYSAIRAAKGFPTRTVWTPQPPWSGFAFDSSVAKLVGGSSFPAQPGERYSFKSQLDLNCAKASIEYWFRITGTDLVKLGESTVSRSTTNNSTVVTGASSTIEVGVDVPAGTMIEVQVRGRSLAPIIDPGHLADNVWLIVTRQAGTGPVVLIDDTALADEAEIHEYERKSLMLREQPDVADWAEWVVTRSSTNRWSMESVSANPDQGDENWSWGMWHSAWLGDRALLEIPDGGELHVETQWIRGMEFRIADTLTMTLHLETVTPPMSALRDSRLSPELHTTVTGEATGPSIPVAGGRIIPTYESRPEIPGWSYQQIGQGLTVSPTGELTWTDTGGINWPIRTGQPPDGFIQLSRGPMLDHVEGDSWSLGFFPRNKFSAKYEGNSNPYGDWSYITMDGYGGLSMWTAEYFNDFVTGAFGSDPKVWEYGQFEFRQGQIQLDVYTFSDSSEPYYGRAGVGVYGNTEGGTGEFFAFGEAEQLEFDHETGVGAYAPNTVYWIDATHYIQARPIPNARLRVGVSGYTSPFAYDTIRDLKVTDDWIGVCDGVATLRLPPRRGCVSYLTYVDGARSTASDPRVKQYQRQMGSTAVTFAAGVGTINVGVTMGTYRVPVAQVVGTTVGGPMVAQIASTGTTITCYLNIAHTGTLTVNWSVEYEAVAWPATLTVDIMGVGPAGGGVGSEFYNFLTPDESESAIPYAATGNLALRIQGPYASTAVGVVNSAGTTIGSMSAGSGPQQKIWTVAANAMAAGTGDWFHLVDGSGNTSNMFFVRWVTPLVFDSSAMTREAPAPHPTPEERRAGQRTERDERDERDERPRHTVDEEGVVHATRRTQRRHR